MCEWGKTTQVKLCKRRKFNGKWYVPVDSCIANIVQALNDAGIETVASCCGHGKGLGNIVLADKRELLIIKDYKTAREISNWFLNKEKIERKTQKKK